jgi:LmbE family N-acetylglucosaminyl deacetylase
MQAEIEPVMRNIISGDGEGRILLRTLVLIAHPDDETACAGLLQRLVEPTVVVVTNGAPADQFFWRFYGSRNAYAAVRRKEAMLASALRGAGQLEFLNDHAPVGLEFEDQRLYRLLPQAVQVLCPIFDEFRPDVIIVPAYEGGHPDHDSCSFLGSLLGRLFAVQVWEMPLYHRSDGDELICQRFRDVDGGEQALALSAREKRTRGRMIAAYASQNVADFVSSDAELYRPQRAYDYAQRPYAGTLNYEAWQWPIAPSEICQAFVDCGLSISRSHAATRAQTAPPAR